MGSGSRGLARRIVIPLQQPRKPLVRHLPGSSSGAARGRSRPIAILHAPLLPRRVRVAEERFDPQGVQFMMPHELRPLSNVTVCRNSGGNGPRRRAMAFTTGPASFEGSRTAIIRRECRSCSTSATAPDLPNCKVSLPVAEGLTGLQQRAGAASDDGSRMKDDRTAPLAHTPAAFPLRLRQILPPAVVFLPRFLGVDEPVGSRRR